MRSGFEHPSSHPSSLFQRVGYLPLWLSFNRDDVVVGSRSSSRLVSSYTGASLHRQIIAGCGTKGLCSSFSLVTFRGRYRTNMVVPPTTQNQDRFRGTSVVFNLYNIFSEASFTSLLNTRTVLYILLSFYPSLLSFYTTPISLSMSYMFLSSSGSPAGNRHSLCTRV